MEVREKNEERKQSAACVPTAALRSRGQIGASVSHRVVDFFFTDRLRNQARKHQSLSKVYCECQIQKKRKKERKKEGKGKNSRTEERSRP